MMMDNLLALKIRILQGNQSKMQHKVHDFDRKGYLMLNHFACATIQVAT